MKPMVKKTKIIGSASILVIRDGKPDKKSNTLEVLLVRRNHNIEFAGGAYVFPGGKFDKDDLQINVEVSDQFPIEFKDYVVTAYRELFEESGLLIGDTKELNILSEQIDEYRKRLLKNHLLFSEFIKKTNIKFNIDDIIPFARWITPKDYPKRFDTRFFLVKAPHNQIASPDQYEAVDVKWAKPLEFIEQFKERMMFPTIMNLKLLGQATNVKEAFLKARSRKIIALEPKIIDGKRYINPDAGYGEINQENIHQGMENKKS